MDDYVFWLVISNGLLILLVGYLYQRFPPKKINYIYGYRTKRSMANQQVWDYANSLGAKMIIRVGWLVLAVGLISYYLLPEHSLIITVSALIIFLLGSLYYSEKELDRHFDKHGNPLVKR